MSASHVEFTPAGAVLLPTNYLPTVVTLPPPDPSAAATVLSNLSHHTVAIKAGGTGDPQFHTAGSITLQALQTVLTCDPAFAGAEQAAVRTLGGIVFDGEKVMQGDAIGTGLMFTRGSTRDVWLFVNPGTEVI